MLLLPIDKLEIVGAWQYKQGGQWKFDFILTIVCNDAPNLQVI